MHSRKYPTLPHTEVILEEIEASCTTSGLTEGKYCSVCNKTLVAQKELGEWHDQASNPCYICGKKYETSKTYFEFYKYGNGYACYQKDDATLPQFIVVPSNYQGEPVVDCIMPYGTGIQTLEFSEGLLTLSRCFLYGKTSSVKHIILPKSLETIAFDSFGVCTSLEAIFYAGSESDWENVSVEIGNDALYSAKMYYYSEVKPESDGKFWHYNEYGQIEIWTLETPTSYFTFKSFGSYYIISAADVNNMPEHVVIPSEYNGKPVQEISDYAFAGCTNLKTIIIPSSVQIIGYSAFEYCTGLEFVTINDGLSEIRACAFYECSDLIKLNIPNSVSKIDSAVFVGCNKLISKDKGIHYVGKWAVDCDKNLSDVSIREGTVALRDQLFTYQGNIQSVTIPSTVKKIPSYAFSNCTALESVIISEGVELIDNYAFQNCTALKYIEYPETLIDVRQYAFDGCTSLLAVEGGVTYAGAWAVDYDESTENVVLKEGTLGIAEYVFYNTDKLITVKLPSSLRVIGKSAFKYSTKLSEIIIPEGVKHLGNNVFDSCESLVTLTIPSSITEIPYEMCYSCELLTTVVLHDNITSIGRQAFYNCTNLTYINLPESLTFMDTHTFMGCYKSLKEITIPESLKEIPEGAFWDTPLEKVYILSNDVTVKANAFRETKLTEVYFAGTASEWSALTVESGNDPLSSATLYCYSETEPTVEGNYWHYVDGEIVVW